MKLHPLIESSTCEHVKILPYHWSSVVTLYAFAIPKAYASRRIPGLKLQDNGKNWKIIGLTSFRSHASSYQHDPDNTLKQSTQIFIMTSLRRCTWNATLISLCLAGANGAFGQVGSINSAAYSLRTFNDVPGATLNTVELYNSLIAFNEVGVSSTNGFANRDVWRFSNNGGTSAYQFQNNDYFNASMTLQLVGSPITPRKEAGWLFSTASNGDIQLIVNTDGHEVVQFGGISFWSFNPLTYNSGDIIHLGMNYFLNTTTGDNALQFFANGHASPVFNFAPGGGIGNGSTLGGYFQIQNDPNNPNNSGAAVFQNITITVPEPSCLVLLSAGLLPLLLRRRRI